MANKKNFYAVTLWDGEKTTTGNANEKTGRYSIACDMHVFNNKNERDSFVKNATYKTKVVTKKELRNHFLGMSVEVFNQEIEYSAYLND